MTPVAIIFVKAAFWKFLIFAMIGLLDAEIIVQREYTKRVIQLLLEADQATEVARLLVIGYFDPLVAKLLQNLVPKRRHMFEVRAGNLEKPRIPRSYKRIEWMIISAS